MGYDCTLHHLLLSRFEQAGKRVQSQVIPDTKAALCTYATTLLLSFTVDTAMFTGGHQSRARAQAQISMT